MTNSTRNSINDLEKKSLPPLSSPIVSKREPVNGIHQKPIKLDDTKYTDQGSHPLTAALPFATPDRSSIVTNRNQPTTDPRSSRNSSPYSNNLTASPITSRESKVASEESNDTKEHESEQKMIRVTPPERYARKMNGTFPSRCCPSGDSFNNRMSLDSLKSSPPPGMNQVTPMKEHPKFEIDSVSTSVSKAVAQTNLDDMSKPSSEQKSRGTVSRRGGRTGAMSPAKFVVTKSEDSTPALLKESEQCEYREAKVESPEYHSKSTITAPPRTLSLKPRKYSCSSIHENDPKTDSRMQGSNLSGNDVGSTSYERMNRSKPTESSNLNGEPELNSSPGSMRPISSRSPCPSSPVPRSLSGSGSRQIKPEEQTKDRNVTFSPVPPQKAYYSDRGGRTPVRSPPPSQQFGDFSGFDARLGSPGFMLSPFFTASPYTDQMTQIGERKGSVPFRPGSQAGENDAAGKKNENINKDKTSERDRSGTPTNFANDFGRGDLQSSSFDTGNVLSWLQSPTANSLFSPGGIMSQTNTPRGMYASLLRTPRTPVLNSGVYLSDSDLPQNVNITSPKPEPNPFSNKPKGAMPSSHLICISPLASTRKTPTKSSFQSSSQSDTMYKRNQAPNTPNDLRDVFASPKPPAQDTELKGHDTSHDNGSNKNGSQKYSLDVHMAQRDVYADEDLSVLLQLAESTPQGKGGKKPLPVDHTKRNQMKAVPCPPSSLQLPLIGKTSGRISSPSKLSRKTAFRDHTSRNSDDFVPPQLTLRATPSGSKSHGSHDIRQNVPSVYDTPMSKRNGKKASTPRVETSQNELPYEQHHQQPMFQRSLSGGRPPVPSPSSGSYGMHHSHYGQNPPSGPGSFGSVPGRPPPPQLHRPPPSSGYPHSSHLPPPHQLASHQPYHYQYSGSQSSHPPYPPMYSNPTPPNHNQNSPASKKSQKQDMSARVGSKRGNATQQANPNKKSKKNTPSSKGRRSKSSGAGNGAATADVADREKSAAAISAINKANGSKNDKAAALAAAILRGVTMRPSGKWQAQLYYAGKSRYIGVFDTREKAALAYEIAREKLKSDKVNSNDQSDASTEAAVNAARRAAFEGVNEKDPRLMK